MLMLLHFNSESVSRSHPVVAPLIKPSVDNYPKQKEEGNTRRTQSSAHSLPDTCFVTSASESAYIICADSDADTVKQSVTVSLISRHLGKHLPLEMRMMSDVSDKDDL